MDIDFDMKVPTNKVCLIFPFSDHKLAHLFQRLNVEVGCIGAYGEHKYPSFSEKNEMEVPGNGDFFRIEDLIIVVTTIQVHKKLFPYDKEIEK